VLLIGIMGEGSNNKEEEDRVEEGIRITIIIMVEEEVEGEEGEGISGQSVFSPSCSKETD